MLGKKKLKRKKKATKGGGKRCSQPGWLRSATLLGFICISLCSGSPEKLRAQPCTGIRGSGAVEAMHCFPGSFFPWIIFSLDQPRTWVLAKPCSINSSDPGPHPCPTDRAPAFAGAFLHFMCVQVGLSHGWRQSGCGIPSPELLRNSRAGRNSLCSLMLGEP